MHTPAPVCLLGVFTAITLRCTATRLYKTHSYDVRALSLRPTLHYTISGSPALTMQKVHNVDLCSDAATLSTGSVPGDADSGRLQRATTSNKRHLRLWPIVPSGALNADRHVTDHPRHDVMQQVFPPHSQASQLQTATLFCRTTSMHAVLATVVYGYRTLPFCTIVGCKNNNWLPLNGTMSTCQQIAVGLV